MRQTLDNVDAPLATASYDPWGTPQGSAISPFGFTGELQDGAGLTYLRARWYTPGTGTFLAVDPFEGFPEQPYTQHPYNYALSNPVLHTDPTGRVYQDDRGERCPPWTSWDNFLKQCRPDWGAPPPNNPTTSRSNSEKAPVTLDALLPNSQENTTSVIGGVRRPGLSDDDKSRLLNLLGGLCLLSLDAASQSNEQPKKRDNTDEFVGFHGTSSVHVPSLLNKISPAFGLNTGGKGQLGKGFYTTPDIQAALFFGQNAVLTSGGEPVAVPIYSTRKLSMLWGQEVPSALWGRVPQELIDKYDFLYSPISGYEAALQIKFNPRAYKYLRARLN